MKHASISFRLNGDPVVVDDPDPAERLVDFLRGRGLTGTKVGCGEGGCGACTVMLSRQGRDGVEHLAINSCLRPTVMVDAMAVTTIEGLGSWRAGLDPVQYAIAMGNGTQCGFCTPGFVMTMHALLQGDPAPTAGTIESGFDGHLCRCTGYRPILQSLRGFARDDAPANDGPSLLPLPALFRRRADPPPTAIVPSATHREGETSFASERFSWTRPATLRRAHELKELLGGAARLVHGNTSVGVYPHEPASICIDISRIDRLNDLAIDDDDDRMTFGAGVTYRDLISFIEGPVAGLGPRGSSLVAVLPLLKRTGSVQIRNVATVAGNVMMVLGHAGGGEPFPSDFATALLALDATITVASRRWPADGDDRAPATRSFPIFSAPPIDQWPPDFIVTSFDVPLAAADGEYVSVHKVARRPQLDHAIVNMVVRVAFDAEGRVTTSRVAIGGIAVTPIRARRAERVALGRTWDDSLRRDATAALLDDVREAHAATTDDRESLVLGLYFKSFVEIGLSIAPQTIDPSDRSAGEVADRPLSRARQRFVSDHREASVGQPYTKMTAFVQATGEARYTDDLPVSAMTLHAAFVQSPHAKAAYSWKTSIETLVSELRRSEPGFRDLLTVDDLPVRSANCIDPATGFDLLLADGEVTWFGQPIALVVADDAAQALRLARRLRVDSILYRLESPVLTVAQALALPGSAGLFADSSPELDHVVRPDSDERWLAEPTLPMTGTEVLSGVQESGAQAHLYMEPQAVLVEPGPASTVRVVAASQDTVSLRRVVASVLGISDSDVEVCVPLVGGGFGGKTTRVPFMAGPVAVAAWKLGRPVRLATDRAADLAMIGKRHPFTSNYWAAYAPDGRVNAFRADLVSDGGNSVDCSFYVMNWAIASGDAAYAIDTFQLDGRVARTNTASNTAMRGFGQPQATLVMEDMIEQVAHRLAMSAEDVRARNLYSDQDRTPAGQPLHDCDLQTLWPRLTEDWEIQARRTEITEFNRANRWRKRGLCMMPLKYGVSYTAKMLDQGEALINVSATDGSVLVQSGGVEMGQGLATKLAQIAAQELGIDLARIRVGATVASVVPNATSTGASTGSDLYGGAVADGARLLRERLDRFCASYAAQVGSGTNPIAAWKTDWAELWPTIVSFAWADRVDLRQLGFYATPGITASSPFFYFTYSAAATEVEIDVLTGELTVLRADIAYDAGQSLNPALDLGQVEGGYVQGLGMLTSEEVIFDELGTLLSDSTWSYKAPCSQSIPLDFRVTLRHRPHRDHTGKVVPGAVYSSKSSGEPPLVLAASAFFAIKQAILAARSDAGATDWFALAAPATVERIRRACRVRDTTGAHD